MTYICPGLHDQKSGLCHKTIIGCTWCLMSYFRCSSLNEINITIYLLTPPFVADWTWNMASLHGWGMTETYIFLVYINKGFMHISCKPNMVDLLTCAHASDLMLGRYEGRNGGFLTVKGLSQ